MTTPKPPPPPNPPSPANDTLTTPAELRAALDALERELVHVCAQRDEAWRELSAQRECVVRLLDAGVPAKRAHTIARRFRIHYQSRTTIMLSRRDEDPTNWAPDWAADDDETRKPLAKARAAARPATPASTAKKRAGGQTRKR